MNGFIAGKRHTVKMRMPSRSVQFLVVSSIILLSSVVVGKLNYISTKSGWMNQGDPYKKQLVELQNYGNGFTLKSNRKLPGNNRDRRAASGPVASAPYILEDDQHQYANVRYSGDESNVIFVLTYDRDADNHVSSSSLYRSSDYGNNFESETNKFPSGAKLHPQYHVSQDKSTIVFPDDTLRKIYVSHDEGVTYTGYSVPVDPRSLLFHPTKRDWVLGFDNVDHQLHVSLNLGKSWTLVSDNVRSSGDYSWGVPGVDWEMSSTNKSKLSKLYYNTYNPDGIGNDVSLMISHYPFGSSSSRVFDQNLGLHDAFLIDDKYIFVQRTVDMDTTEVELLVSYNRMPFNVARIPFEDSHDSYYVGSYRSAQALVIVRHTSGVDNLYLSDETGTYYSLSLDTIVLDEQQGLDLELIESMNGTFIANQHVGGSTGGMIRTVITFDNGAEWHLLEAPEVTSDGSETDCEIPLCSLHLQMYSTDFSRLGVYSRSSAPGIIIAHGNYGQSLSQDVDLYISRDGGLRWEQTLVSLWDVQIIDHGGLLVAAKDYRQLDETYIKYSCDEGRSWTNFNFTTTATVIWGVVTEPGETTTEVALFGSEDRSLEWAIISINFTGVFQRKCAGNDYWQWAVSDGRIADQNCLLGESRVIERRKIETCCLSGEQYERIVSVAPCDCAREDFECDWGYRSDDYNEGKCVVDVNFADDSRTDRQCSSGYRKIAGDTCVGGISDDLLNCTPPVNCSSTNKPDKPKTSTTISLHNPSTVTTGSTRQTSTPNANMLNDSDNKGSNTVVIIILAILSILLFVVIIVLGTLVVCMRKRLSYMRQSGYHLAATAEQVTFRGTDDEDDDVALLRP